jgi:hypothetical protein
MSLGQWSFIISVITLLITILIFIYQQKILDKNEKLAKLFAENVLNKLKN